MKKDIIFRMMNVDPRISRIDKILAKFCPKFFDLYASIYGSLKFKKIFRNQVKRRKVYGDITQNATEEELEQLLINFDNHVPSVIAALEDRVRAKGTRYRFPSLCAVDTFRHFVAQILKSQIRSPFLTGKLSFWTNFPMSISEFADIKTANNEGRLYREIRLMLFS